MTYRHCLVHRSAILLIALLISGCATARPSVLPGEIPDQGPPTVEEEQSGHQVFGQLVEQYPLSRDNEQIFRLRAIVEKLTAPLNDPERIWHVYLLEGAEIKNAAATKGNYIFVWTGLLNEASTDAELATVLAHEIAHILSGHTRPEPSELISQVFSDIAAQTAQHAVYQVGGPFGSLAGIAGALAELLFDAALVNPTAQRKEHEADQIGLFLMADACYNPQAAADFWQRSPTGEGLGVLNVFSTHPTSNERLQSLEALLPLALDRYQEQCGIPGFAAESSTASLEHWEVVSATAVVQEPEENAQVLQVLQPTTQIRVVRRVGQWLRIVEPTAGFVFGPDCSPLSS